MLSINHQFIKTHQSKLRTVLGIIIFALVYHIVSELSLIVRVANNNVIPLWPAVGIGFAVLFLWGYRFWPGIWLSEASDLFILGTLTPAQLLTATGNTLAILLGVWLVRCFVTTQDLLIRSINIVIFISLGAIFISIFSALVRTGVLYQYNFINQTEFITVWWTWCLANIVGILVVAPVIITWYTHHKSKPKHPQLFETICFWLCFCLTIWLVFGQFFHPDLHLHPLTVLVMPVLIWAALRFSQYETLLMVLLLSIIAVISTVQDLGPFTQYSLYESLLLLQTFIVVISITLLFLTTVIRERTALEKSLHKMNETLAKCVAERTGDLCHTNEQLRQATEKYQSIFINAIEGIYQISPAQRLLNANPALAKMYGFENPKQMITEIHDVEKCYVNQECRAKFHRLMAENGTVYEFEAEVYHKNGEIMWISENSRTVCDNDGNLLYYEGTMIDITEHKHAQEQLVQMAHYDSLTGLANQRLLQVRLKQAMARANHLGQQGLLMLFDLDGFQQINETLGHEFGDELLKQTAHRLKIYLRETDLVCRLGSDEFIVVAEHVTLEQDAVKIAKKLLSQLTRPYHYRNDQVQIGVSIGVTFFDGQNDNVENLLHQVDLAMYRAKQSGKGTYWFYTSSLEQPA